MTEKKEYIPTFSEKCILHSIIEMSSKKNQFYQTNEKIAELFNLSVSSVKVMISHLITNGYIKKEKSNGYRYLKYTGKKFDKIPVFANITKAEAIMSIKKYKDALEEIKKLKKEIEILKKKHSQSKE